MNKTSSACNNIQLKTGKSGVPGIIFHLQSPWDGAISGIIDIRLIKPMIFITNLIYISEGQEEVFDEFEKIAIPIMAQYNGKMLLRLRPAKEAFIEQSIESPYEVHLGEFESEEDFEAFLNDERRKQFLHLKDKAIRSTILVKGKRS